VYFREQLKPMPKSGVGFFIGLFPLTISRSRTRRRLAA